MNALENRGVPHPVIEQDERIVHGIFHVENDELELDDFAGNGGNVVEEPLGCSALIAHLHARAGQVGDARGAQVAAFGGANVEETVVDADRVVQIVNRDVLVGRKRLLHRIGRIRHPGARVQADEEVVELRALEVPVFGREKPELVGEGFRIGWRANFHAQIDGITCPRSSVARPGTTFRTRKFVAVREQIRSGWLRCRSNVGAGSSVTRVVLIAHDAGGHASNRGPFERDDVHAKPRHDRRLFVLDIG